MSQNDELTGLSRRERQIMDFLFQRGKASVGEVMDGIPDPPGYSAVRATLRTLEQKAAYPTRRRQGLHLPTNPPARCGTQVGAHACRQDVLRQFGGASACRAPRAEGTEAFRSGAREGIAPRREREEGGTLRCCSNS